MSTPVLPAESLSMREVLRIATMRRLWYAQVVSTFGDFLALFAVIAVLTFKLHATAQQITSVQIAYLLPIAVLGILSGVFVDRWPLKPTLVASDIVRCGLVLLLMLATRTWHFYLVLAAISVVSSFFGPAQGAMIRTAVPLHGLRSANALMQQVMFVLRIIGPAAAGLLVGTFGPASCYVLDAVSFAASACFIASVAFTPPLATEPAAPVEDRGRLAKIAFDMREGIGFIVHHAALLFVILALASGMFVMGCFGPLIAVYVRDSIHAGNRIYGLASGMIGVGILLGMNLINTFGKTMRNTVLVYSGLAGIAAGLMILAGLPHVWSLMVGDFVIGFFVAAIIIPAQTMIQQETPPPLMGRVGSTVMSTIFTAQVLGLVLSGALAQVTGVRHVFALCAGMLILLVLAGKFFMEPKTLAAPTIPGTPA